jgi:exodeoxyribonuclease-3
MRIATWNVNSLKIRLGQTLDWLAANQPDVLCLQETKLEVVGELVNEFHNAGYCGIFSGQKAYNGVAIISKHEIKEEAYGIPNFSDEQKRVVAATIEGVRVVCIYVPNGQSVDSDKYQYKLKWLTALTDWLSEELKRHPKLIVLGDYNIAPEDTDVHDPIAWQGQVLVSEPERDAFKKLLSLGLCDSFRLFEQTEKSFSWWDYRMNAFKRNHGLRIDHILLSNELVKQCTACTIDKQVRANERPSDHVPVVVTI